MKLPEYSLKGGVEYKAMDSGQDPAVEFAAGTLVFPFWNETLLPKHRFDELKKYMRFMPPEKQMVMCIIGRYWVPVPKEMIRRNG